MAAFARSALHGLLLSTSLISLAALPAFAQSAANNPAVSELDLPEVVVSASQVPVEASKVGSAVTVISGEELRADGITTVPDALRQIAGVAVGTTGPRGGLTEVRMRGMKPTHVMVMIDGVKVNGVDNNSFDFAGFLVDDIERIEVLRGPQSGVWGADAQAGVISVITKSGRGLAKPEMTARAEAGTRNSGGGAASVRGAAGPVYGALTVSQDSTRGFNVSRWGSETDGSHAAVVSGKAGIDFNEYFNLEGSVHWMDRATKTDNNDYSTIGYQPDFTPIPANPVTYGMVVDKADTSAYDNLSAGAVGTLKLWDGHWTQTFGIRSFEHNLESRSQDWGNYSYNGRRTTLDTKGALKFETPWLAGAQNTIAIGADYQDEDYRQNGPYVDPAWAAGMSRSQTGLFAEYLLDLPTGLALSAAVRHDDFEMFDDADTWRVTASQKLSTGTRLHSSVGTGVTKPTFLQQYGTIPGTFVGNPSLSPEQSTGWDAGVEQTLIDGKLFFDVTYFWMNLTDEIRTITLGSGLKSAVNSPAKTERQGVEVALKVEPLPWLSLEGTYTYTDAEAYDTTQLAVLGATRIPQHAASGRATVKFDEGRGRATVAVVFNGSMMDTFYGLNTERVELGSYTLVNALVSYDLTPQTTVYLRAENVFDEKYEEVYSYVSPGATVLAGLKVKLGGEAASVAVK